MFPSLSSWDYEGNKWAWEVAAQDHSEEEYREAGA